MTSQDFAVIFLPPWKPEHHDRRCITPFLSLSSPLYRLLPFHLSPTVSQFVADVPPAHRSYFLRDLCCLQESVQGGHVSNRCTVALYGQCSSFCTDFQLDQLLEKPDIPTINTLQVYRQWVRNGGFSSQAYFLRSQLVVTAWRAITETHSLEGHRDPHKPSGSHSRDLDKFLTRMLQQFSYQDSPLQREKAIPLGLVMAATAAANPSC